MSVLTTDKLEGIEGGQSLSGAIIDAFTSAGRELFKIGRSLGSSIRRIFEGNLCRLG